MNMKQILIVLLSILVLCTSCTDKKKTELAFYENEDLIDDDETTDDTSSNTVSYDNIDNNEVCIPFSEEGGVKLIDVTVNGQFTVKMILDSGCSGTLISIAEAKYLYEKGCFTKDDILGTTHSQIADGSIVENMVINLKQLVIGDQISCSNVTATVSSNAQAPLLLGNEVLNRAPSYSVDNENKIIKFKLR